MLHVATKHYNMKSYTRDLMAPIDLTLSDLQRSKSRSFRHRVIEDQHSVNIYFLGVFHIVYFVGGRGFQLSQRSFLFFRNHP